jgi:hypothetical protein
VHLAAGIVGKLVVPRVRPPRSVEEGHLEVVGREISLV